MRSAAAFSKLPELQRRVRELEALVAALTEAATETEK